MTNKSARNLKQAVVVSSRVEVVQKSAKPAQTSKTSIRPEAKEIDKEFLDIAAKQLVSLELRTSSSV